MRRFSLNQMFVQPTLPLWMSLETPLISPMQKPLPDVEVMFMNKKKKIAKKKRTKRKTKNYNIQLRVK